MASLTAPRAAALDAPLILLALLVALPSCGGAGAEPPTSAASTTAPVPPRPAPAPPPAAAEQAPPAEEAIPTACAGSGAHCTPPAGFVKKLCGSYFPDVALAMFAKGTPWTRGYLTRNTDAWYASGGAASSDKLVFDEEVIILMHRAPSSPGGIVVSGASGGYDVLRWDGSCASLDGAEIATRLPPSPKYPAIPWKKLDVKVRDALRQDPKVEEAYQERSRECKGATMGSVSAKCEKADRKLSVVIVKYIREGGRVPVTTLPR